MNIEEIKEVLEHEIISIENQPLGITEYDEFVLDGLYLAIELLENRDKRNKMFPNVK